jgi:hypothetical protein
MVGVSDGYRPLHMVLVISVVKKSGLERFRAVRERFRLLLNVLIV